MKQLKKAVKKYNPDAIIYNYMGETLPWTVDCETHSSLIYDIDLPQIAIIHSAEQYVINNAVARSLNLVSEPINELFDFYISSDPTTLLSNPLVYKSGRPLLKYKNEYKPSETPTFGCATLATCGKGFERMVTEIQKEYDKVIIRINAPKADFVNKMYDLSDLLPNTMRDKIPEANVQQAFVLIVL